MALLSQPSQATAVALTAAERRLRALLRALAAVLFLAAIVYAIGPFIGDLFREPPFVVLHDSDLRPGREPSDADRKLNRLIRRLAGARRTVVLDPDFEWVAGVRGKRKKPERAWSHLAHATPDELPEPLVRAVKLAMASMHPREPSYS